MDKNDDSQNSFKSNHSFNFTFQKSESFLISHKSFLEVILEQIKSHQYNFLSEKKNLKKIKYYLNIMKQNLTSILKEQLNYEKFLEKKNNTQKSKIQNELYNQKINKDIIINPFNSVCGVDYIIQKENAVKSKNNKINYINEKQQLEILIFKAENEISKIEFEIQKKIKLIIYLRTERLIEEENLEIDATQKKLKSKALNIMKKKLKNSQKDLLKIINKKIKNDIKVNKIREEIELVKKQIKNQENYVDSENIIFEDSIDCKRSIDMDSSQENDIIIGKKQKIKNINKIINTNPNRVKSNNRCSVDVVNHIYGINRIKNKIKDHNMNFDDINEKINTKVIRSLSNKIKKINLKNIENNCNLNINLNFNVNNINIINRQSDEDKINYTNKSFNEDNYNKDKDKDKDNI